MPDLQELHWTNEPKTEKTPRYSFGLRGADRLSARASALLSGAGTGVLKR